jgi:uncharacterized protein (TIGR03437 family)
MALVTQITNSRQGNANSVFYKLAAQQPAADCNSSQPVSTACIFNDIASGTIAMPCTRGTTNCNTSNSNRKYGVLSGYGAAPGYDLATGLGTVNVFNLVTASAWQSLADAPAASINEGGVLNAASYEVGAAVAPGSIAAVYGIFPLSSFPPKEGLPLPPMLAGLAFRFGAGFPAPLLRFRALKSTYRYLGVGAANRFTAYCYTGGRPSPMQFVRIARFAPGVFSVNGQGTGQGAILDEAYHLADISNPAGTDAIIQIYCTGLGAVTNQPPSGAAAPGEPLAETTVSPVVTIGGAVAPALFSGLVPGSVGLYQVNARIPRDAARGAAVALSVSIGGVTSNAVTIALR